MERQENRVARTVAWLALLALSLVHFIALSSSRGRYGYADLPIFLATAAHYRETGDLYPRADDPEAFRPAAPVYKFPPLFAAFLVPSVGDGIDTGDYVLHWSVQMLLYAAAVGLLLATASASLSRAGVLAGVVLALNFTPYFETLARLQLETPILALIALAAFCERRGHSALAGAAIGVAAALKVYPAFLLAGWLLRRRWMAVPGFVVGLGGATVFSVAVLGPEPHRVWLTSILPTMLGEAPILWTENLAPARTLQTALGVGAGAAAWIGKLLAATVLSVTAFTLWTRGRSRGPERSPGDTAAVLWMIPVMLLAMPNAWANYQLLLLAPAILLPLLATVSGAGGRPSRACPGCWCCSAVVAALVLAYAPCEGPETFRYAWPCAQTPYLFGLVRLPRGVHDLWVELRTLAPLAAWAGGWLAFRALDAGRAPDRAT